MTSAGLPHSGIDGALPACGPPSLFAACHALHRPVSPRHPPHTGSCLRTAVLAARQNSDHVARDLVHRSLFNCQGAAPCGAPTIISVGRTHGKAYTTLQPCRRRTADCQCPEDVIIGRKGSRVRGRVKEMPSSMPSTLTFRAAIAAAAVLVIVAIAAIVNHFTSHTPHPVFGLKVGLLLILCALACGIWANYNRPPSRA